MKDLGFINGWKYTIENNRLVYSPEDHPDYCKCREQDHLLRVVDHSPRGSDTEYICDACGICWHIDSSD